MVMALIDLALRAHEERIEGLLLDSFDSPGVSTRGATIFAPRLFSNSAELDGRLSLANPDHPLAAAYAARRERRKNSDLHRRLIRELQRSVDEGGVEADGSTDVGIGASNDGEREREQAGGGPRGGRLGGDGAPRTLPPHVRDVRVFSRSNSTDEGLLGPGGVGRGGAVVDGRGELLAPPGLGRCAGVSEAVVDTGADVGGDGSIRGGWQCQLDRLAGRGRRRRR